MSTKMEPATPFATGEKVYNERTTPKKSFGQLFLSLIAMRRKHQYCYVYNPKFENCKGLYSCIS